MAQVLQTFRTHLCCSIMSKQFRCTSRWAAPQHSTEEILAKWHTSTMRILADAVPDHQVFSTINGGLRLLKGKISPTVKNKILKLSSAYSVVRHLTEALAENVTTLLEKELLYPHSSSNGDSKSTAVRIFIGRPCVPQRPMGKGYSPRHGFFRSVL